MSVDEEIQARSLIQDTQTMFLSSIKEVTFTKNDLACEDEGSSVDAIGCYRGGKVIVEWQDSDLRENARIFCHEVLHSYFKNSKGNLYEDDSHASLDWIAQRYGCYYLSLNLFEPYFVIEKETCNTDNSCVRENTDLIIVKKILNATSYDYCYENGMESMGVPGGYGCAELVWKYRLSTAFLNDKCYLLDENTYECNFENKYFVEVIR